MTQQALRELVAKWRRELREVDSDRDNYSPPSADYFASELESLLGEQREAQGAESYRTALAKINCIRNSIVGMQGFNFSMHAYPLVAALNAVGFEGMSYEDAKAYHLRLRETMKNPGDEISDSAPPLAESVGDVKALARELAESIDFTDDRAQARVVFEKILPYALRRHMQQAGDKK